MGTSNPTGATPSDDSDMGDHASWASLAAERAQGAANEAADTIKSRARDVAEQQKQAGAEQIEGVADAMKAAADDLERKVPLAAEYIDEVAGQLGSVASALRQRSIDDMVGNVADFARKQPTAFFAGAVAAGFALSRFAKSSVKREDSRNV
jgi:hypothetical protein